MNQQAHLQKQLKALQLFDPQWYLQSSIEAAKSGMDPLRHFVQFGLPQGRQPGPSFDPVDYVRANPDLNTPDINPLIHYLESGYYEGRPRSLAERTLMDMEQSIWPQAPVPGGLPEWLGRRPGSAPDGMCRILYVLSIQSGGTPQTNQDLMQSLMQRQDTRVECLVLRCAGRYMRLYFFKSGIYIPLEEHRLAAPIMPFPHAAPEYDSVIAEWLAGYGVSLVHVRHSAFQGLGLIETARLQNIPVLYSFHDYYTVCPSVKLLDENQQFCRGRCTQSPGSCGIELWPDSLIASLKHNAVYQWQRQFARNLGLCSGFIACTAAVQHIVQDIFPAISEKPFALIEHGRDFDLLTSLACRPEPGTPLRVLLPGHLERAKGAEILLEMARAEGLQQVEWHVLGTVGTEFQHRMPANVKVHGGYQREAFQDHVKRIQPHMGAILSIWPETWCHTLTELWATGLPVVAFNLGAVGDRIAASQAGWLAEQVSAQAMIKTIKTASQTAEWANAQNHTMRWQREAQRSCADMAEDYWRFYQLFF